MQILANGFFRVLKGEECLVGVTAGKGRKEVVKNAVFYLGRFPLPGWLEFSTLIEPPLGEPHLSMMVLCLAQNIIVHRILALFSEIVMKCVDVLSLSFQIEQTKHVEEVLRAEELLNLRNIFYSLKWMTVLSSKGQK